MSLEVLEKQPRESRVYTIDFSPNMQEGETITSVTTFDVTPAGLTYNSATPSGQLIAVRFSGGTASTQYKWSAVVVTSLGNTLEDDGYLHVKDN